MKRINGNKVVAKYLKNIDKDKEYDKHIALVIEYLKQFSYDYDFVSELKKSYEKKILDFIEYS